MTKALATAFYLALAGASALAFGPEAAHGARPGAGASRYLMGAVGDSVSVAFIADTRLGGDSATLEFRESKDLIDNKATLSWVSGMKIRSHALMLKEFLSREGRGSEMPLKILNAAQNGAKAQDAARQAEEIVKEFKEGDYQALAYVTFFLGSNDVCALKPVAEIEKSVEAALETLARVEQDEPLRVLVSGVLEMGQLTAREIVEHPMLGFSNCGQIRDDFLNACPILRTYRTEAGRRESDRYLREVNEALRRVSESAGRRHPGLSVHFSDRLFGESIGVGDLAKDCFHPNAVGQQKISDALWAEQPWFRQ